MLKNKGVLYLLIIIYLIVEVIGVDLKISNDSLSTKETQKISQRKQKQLFYRNTWYEALEEGGPCLTSNGNIGSCISLQNCFSYLNIPKLSAWDTLVLRDQEQCIYFSNFGLQSIGVCCIKQIKPNDLETVVNITTNGLELKNQTESKTKIEGYTKDQKNQHWPIAVPPNPQLFGSQWPQNNFYQKWPPFISTLPGSTEISYWPPTIPPIPAHPPNHTPATHPPQIPSSTLYPWPVKPSPGYPTHPTRPTYYPTIPQTPTSTSAKPPTFAGCGAKNNDLDQERIVGGQNASPNEWPWMVVLFNGGRQFCGGSLIDNIHVLTAAHCVAQMTSWDVARLKAHLGDYNIRTNNEVPHVERKIRRVVRHRGFNSVTLYNDVAILTLDQPVSFSSSIQPICLPSSYSKPYSGKTGIVAGWGSLRENGPQPSILQQTSVPIWSNGQCARKYGSAAPGGIIDSMICAGQDYHDACSGDSGGPLMYYDGKWTQIGIVSWGIGCGKGNYPGVYTRVSSFLPWITKNLNS